MKSNFLMVLFRPFACKGMGQQFLTERAVLDSCNASESARLIMTLPQGRSVFLFYCHNLEHEDEGIMLNLETVIRHKEYLVLFSPHS